MKRSIVQVLPTLRLHFVPLQSFPSLRGSLRSLSLFFYFALSLILPQISKHAIQMVDALMCQLFRTVVFELDGT